MYRFHYHRLWKAREEPYFVPFLVMDLYVRSYLKLGMTNVHYLSDFS